MTKNEVAYPILSYEDFLESDLKIHTHLVSDLDGTLVLSKKATQAAYKEAGKELPDSDWGKSAQDWGCPPDVHKKKQEIWPRFTHLLEFSPAATSIWNLNCWSSRIILTGASEPTFNATYLWMLQNGFPSSDKDLLGMSLRSKSQFLSFFPYRFVYLDDNLEALQEFSRLTFLGNPTLVHVNFESNS